eukprot:56890-Alexandrium_andersonii.AAC.1
MSASLVGSEMCIRDSQDGQIGCAGVRRGPARNAGPLPAHGASNLRSSGAVSYTHLTLPTICSV